MFKEIVIVCAKDGALMAWLMLIFSMCLAIASFLVPPLGIIDGSVLLVIAELNTFYVLIFKLPNIIQSIRDGKSVRLKYKDAEVEVRSDEERHPE